MRDEGPCASQGEAMRRGKAPRTVPYSVAEFWEHTTPLPETGCLLTLLGEGDYGHAWVSGCRERAAHRVSVELTYGPIPKGLQALHRCDVTGCVNPDHLYIGTKEDNSRDAYFRGRNLMARIRRRAKQAQLGAAPAYLLKGLSP